MTNTLIPLTAEQVYFLRQLGKDARSLPQANAVVVNYYSDTNEYELYVCATTRPIKGATTDPNYGDVRFHYPASGICHRYDSRGDRVGRHEEPRPFRLCGQQSVYFFGSEGSIESLRSIANLIRKGDGLHIKFVIGNSTETLKKAGLQQDEAYISIRRGDKILATFPVDIRVVPTGSLATMLDTSFYRGKAAS